MKTSIDKTWAALENVFSKKYFPRSSKDMYKEEIVMTEELHVRRFERGHRPSIKDKM
ncbi:hypothetical protein U1Q18_027881, partial [Sarracenia purpurea var. burkii]